MKAIGVRAEQNGRTHGRYRPALRDKPESPCQQDAVHTWDVAPDERERFGLAAMHAAGRTAEVSTARAEKAVIEEFPFQLVSVRIGMSVSLPGATSPSRREAHLGWRGCRTKAK